MIEGIKLKMLKNIPDERGRVLEILRKDDPIFQEFGQVYLTTVRPGITKAWHLHKLQSDNICAISGMLKLVIYDDRENSPTRGKINQFFIGDINPCVVHIPPGLYHGFKGISTNQDTLVINVPTHVYNRENPDEYRLDPHDNHIPYDWSAVDR